MNYVAFAFIVAGRLILDAPKMIANTVGYWYESKFTLGDVTIERPQHFNTKAHKAAFEDVGRYVTNALTRDVMISFRDSDLSRESFMRPKGVSIEVWHEVLEFFASADFIQKRWEMRLPPFNASYDQSRHGWATPAWLADGTRMAPPKQSVIGGVIPDSESFMPGLLTEEQKQALLGTQYALTYTDCLSWHGDKDGRPGEQRYVTLADEHFDVVYFRDRKHLNDEQLTDGAHKVASMLNITTKS